MKGKWARITMSDGKYCFIAIGPRSLVLKRSKTGIIGPKLFEIRRLHQVEEIATILKQKFPQDLTPQAMTNSLLKPVVNAILHCNDLDDALVTLRSVDFA